MRLDRASREVSQLLSETGWQTPMTWLFRNASGEQPMRQFGVAYLRWWPNTPTLIERIAPSAASREPNHAHT